MSNDLERPLALQHSHSDASGPGSFSSSDREAIYRVIRARRDVRRGFLPRPLSDDVLQRLLTAAHEAPSVGLMQPSRFLVIRSAETRRQVHSLFLRANEQASLLYNDRQREQYSALKLEGIMEAPQNLCVLCNRKSEQGHGLGRQTVPETAVYSTICAIQNLWLAARAEGVGVGWVSIVSHEDLRSLLKIPAHHEIVAYLCLGYVEAFPPEPELERLGWEQRVPLSSVVFEEAFPFDSR